LEGGSTFASAEERFSIGLGWLQTRGQRMRASNKGTDMHLKEIMTSPVETIAPDASLADAARKMLALEIGLLPVSMGQKIVGIVSDRDITIRAVAKGLDPDRTEVQQIMTQDVFSCQGGSDVMDACGLMEEKQVRRLLVMDADAPIGIVSLGDIALHLRREQSGDVLKKVSQPA
jgi:CBS domain-containing protein